MRYINLVIACFVGICICGMNTNPHSLQKSPHQQGASSVPHNTQKMSTDNFIKAHYKDNQHHEHHEHHQTQRFIYTPVYYPYYYPGYYYPVYPVNPPTNNYSPPANQQTYEAQPQNRAPNIPNTAWVDANNGSVPESAVIDSDERNVNGNRVYYCRVSYFNIIYYGQLYENDACYVSEGLNAPTWRFNNYEVLVQTGH